MGSSPLLSASSVSRGQEIPEHGGQLFSEAACSGDGFELPVDVLSVTLLANADSAHNYDAMLRINTVDHPMVSELVFPIAGQRAAQRQPVFFGLTASFFSKTFRSCFRTLPSRALMSAAASDVYLRSKGGLVVSSDRGAEAEGCFRPLLICQKHPLF